MTDDFKISKLGAGRFDSPLAVCIDEQAGVLLDARVSGGVERRELGPVLEAAGARRKLFFDPATTRAAVVTCGGLCPGLNDVIRALTMVLWYRYGVRELLGLRYGYEGLVSTSDHMPLHLTPERVEDIHQNGGTILGSSRGPQEPAAMTDFLVANNINLLFTVGGDGTQRGALAICREIEKRQLAISVVGIPKTIDNDISFTERTFGFVSAVAMSRMPITCAHMEAKGVRNGVGLVKLMGRESGFVAAHAALASSDVNLVLVPEVPFTVPGVLDFLKQRLSSKSHAVVVVAEGAGQEHVPADGRDASGNRRLGDIGPYLKRTILDHFRGSSLGVDVKYIDPSYMIRSAPANADDSVFCFELAKNAAHAAMSGRTAMVVGVWNGDFVHVPMVQAVASRKRIDPLGSLWQSVLDNTGQPAAW